ncbi:MULTISPECIES: outer membrane lipoprotein carrier protein LolA [Rhodopseudomonas]|uniref:Membrane protein n=2 Tax=Rhodopseudomonas TaxID=1073 RepID=A0A0D7F3T3_RHOPL|nr:membrane protein [Rhodopseudomonas palustris]
MDFDDLEPRNRHSAGLAPTRRRHDAITPGQDNQLNTDDTASAPRSSHRAVPRATLAMFAAALIATATMPPAAAEQVPMPKPSPKGREIQLSASEPRPQLQARAQTQPQAKPPAPTAAPEPVIPDPRRNVPASIFNSFNDKQKAEAAKVSTYLSSLQTLVGQFVQVGPDGSKLKGDFYIQKPGKVRFEYDAPSPISMVSDGTSLVVRDRKLGTQDVYPLSQTPLRYLLSDRIDLLRDTNVVSVTSDDLYISVIIEEKNTLVGTSRLLLMLSTKDNQLKQWTVTDPQGYDTTVAIYNVDSTQKLDPALFKIDFTNYATPNN